ncbi:MAG: hypothetical protein OXN89_25830 [Bryobacterales bacterium]|nr:hypothetical protein [Bryobacterales bacterium]
MTDVPVTATGAIGLIAKGTLVLSVALVLAWFARRGSAKTLHLLWTTTFAVLLALPVMSLLAPAWVLPIFPARTTAIEHHLPDKTASELSATVNASNAGHPPHSAVPFPTRYLPIPLRGDASIPLTPAAGVFLIWALGCAIGLVSLGAAAFRFRKLVRGATPIRDPDWIRSTDILRHRARVRGDAQILSSAQVSTPMTGGPLRPVILLPVSAETWTSGRLEMVVSHELVHVRRRDALRRLVAGAAVALYWFHPLVWLASRLAAAARERSCDEEVLTLGVRPSAYARHLFSLASEIAAGPPVLSLPVVQHPHLESRIMSILKVHRPRFSRTRTYAALAAVGVVGMVAACARPVRMDPAASPTTRAEIARLPERPTKNPAPPRNPERAVPPSNGTPEEPPATGPIAVAPAVREVLGLQEVECKPGRFTGIMKNRESTTVQVSVHGMSLFMHTSGDIVMTGDGTAVASMEPGSRLVLQSQAQSLHRMAITSGPSGLDHEWSIDGRSRPFDDEARAWRDLMLTVLVRSQEVWEVRGREASMRREIGSHERHVAGLRRDIASHERHVASLRREIASHVRDVASLQRQIASEIVEDAVRLREETQNEVVRQLTSTRVEIVRAEGELRASLRSLNAVAQALDEELDEVRLREETQDEVLRQLTKTQIEIVRAEDELRSSRQVIGEYDLDQQVGDIRQEIERYDLDGKIGDIEAQIEQYDLDGKVRELEAQIEEWDADRRADEIERSIQDAAAALRRLIDAAEQRR